MIIEKQGAIILFKAILLTSEKERLVNNNNSNEDDLYEVTINITQLLPAHQRHSILEIYIYLGSLYTQKKTP